MGRADVENTGMAKMKGAELPNPAQGGARMRSCCIKLETNQPNTKLVCIFKKIISILKSLTLKLEKSLKMAKRENWF